MSKGIRIEVKLYEVEDFAPADAEQTGYEPTEGVVGEKYGLSYLVSDITLKELGSEGAREAIEAAIGHVAGAVARKID